MTEALWNHAFTSVTSSMSAALSNGLGAVIGTAFDANEDTFSLPAAATTIIFNEMLYRDTSLHEDDAMMAATKKVSLLAINLPVLALMSLRPNEDKGMYFFHARGFKVVASSVLCGAVAAAAWPSLTDATGWEHIAASITTCAVSRLVSSLAPRLHEPS